MTTTFLEYQPGLAPTWLQGFWGTRWEQQAGITKDSIAKAATLATTSRFIASSDLSPDDALAPCGQDRALERAPGESTSSYRARLVDAWNAYEWAGTRKGLIDQLHVAGFPNVDVFEQRRPTNENRPSTWDRGKHWSRFWLVIYAPHGFVAPSLVIGGGTVGTGLIGFGGDPVVTLQRLNYLRRVVRKWKPAHAICDFIAIVFSGGVIGGGTVGAGLIGGSVAYIAA